MTLAQLLEANAQKYGERVGYVGPTRTLTHRQYLDRAKQHAAALYARGARRQDRMRSCILCIPGEPRACQKVALSFACVLATVGVAIRGS
jgi:acyl-CoA synthetase (AMP-forming)/AMP-acid ligase II